MTERLSIRAYAKRIGVSHVAVIGAIRRGNLRNAIVVDGGKKLIDAEIADAEWKSNTDESMRKDGRATQIPPARPAPQPAAPEPSPPFQDRDADAGMQTSLQKARTVDATFRARLTKLEFERESGKLVEVQAVQDRIADHVRIALDILASRRRRLAPMLALETDPRAVEAALEQSDREFAAELAALAAPPQPQAEAA